MSNSFCFFYLFWDMLLCLNLECWEPGWKSNGDDLGEEEVVFWLEAWEDEWWAEDEWENVECIVVEEWEENCAAVHWFLGLAPFDDVCVSNCQTDCTDCIRDDEVCELLFKVAATDSDEENDAEKGCEESVWEVSEAEALLVNLALWLWSLFEEGVLLIFNFFAIRHLFFLVCQNQRQISYRPKNESEQLK